MFTTFGAATWLRPEAITTIAANAHGYIHRQRERTPSCDEAELKDEEGWAAAEIIPRSVQAAARTTTTQTILFHRAFNHRNVKTRRARLSH